MRSIFLTLFLLVCFNSNAQLDDYQKDIVSLLEINGAQEEYAPLYEKAFVTLKRNFSTADIPEKVFRELKSDRAKSMDELSHSLSFAYRKQFSHEEILEMTEFYQTDAAQKWLQRNKGELTEEETETVKAYLDSELGKKESAQLQELKDDEKVIADFWWRELFSAKMSALIKKGYRTKF